jgi:hypothetical protein
VEFEMDEAFVEQFGYNRASDCRDWASCIKVVDTLSGETDYLEELEGDEALLRYILPI